MSHSKKLDLIPFFVQGYNFQGRGSLAQVQSKPGSSAPFTLLEWERKGVDHGSGSNCDSEKRTVAGREYQADRSVTFQ